MTKTFKDFLQDSKKTFSFKLWFANAELTSDQLDKLESCLQKYNLENTSKPASTPTREHEFFPGLGPVELTSIEIDLEYPCNATQVYDTVVRAGLKVPSRNIFVVNRGGGAESMYGHPAAKDALLNSTNDADDNSSLYGEKYNEPFLKSLTSKQHEFAGNVPTAKTTKEDSVGNTSPVGSNKTARPPLPKTGSNK